MSILGQVPMNEIQEIARNGSPQILHMVGRAFGLGQDERNALTQGKFPVWFWIATGGLVGIVAGMYAHKKWPNQIDKFLKIK